jgi:hypothetical protein
MNFSALCRWSAGVLVALSQTVANANMNGVNLSGDDVPGWVMGYDRCLATLVTDRVALTSAYCADRFPSNELYRLRDRTSFKVRRVLLKTAADTREGIALLVLDNSAGGDTAPLPSYRQDLRVVVDGARLTVYGRAPVKNYGLRQPARDFDPPTGTSRLEYFRARHFGVTSGEPLRVVPASRMPEEDWRQGRTYSKELSPAERDRRLIGIRPEVTWDSAHPARPFDAEELGGPIHARDGGELIGILTDYRLNARTGDAWPDVIRTLQEEGLHSEAFTLMLKVLNPFEDPSAEKSAPADWRGRRMDLPVGTIWPREDGPPGGGIAYFRLVRKSADGMVPSVPLESRDGNGWEYLGTEFPGQIMATAAFRSWNAKGSTAGAGPQKKPAKLNDVFVHVSPVDESVSYFRLKAWASSGGLAPLPAAGTSDRHWKLIGPDVPVARAGLRGGRRPLTALDPIGAVFNAACDGTVISRRVILTAAQCITGRGDIQFTLRKTGETLSGKGFVPDRSTGRRADLGLVLLDQPVTGEWDGQRPGINSYLTELTFLRSGVPPRIHGARPASALFPRLSTHDDVTAPAKKAIWENNLIQRATSFAAHVDFAEPGAEEETTWFPRIGGALFLRRSLSWAAGPFAIVVDGRKGAARVSHYWPWVHDTLMAQGAREDALYLGAHVLDPWRNQYRSSPERGMGDDGPDGRLSRERPDQLGWGAFDRRGLIGRVYVNDNRDSGEVEFLHLAQAGADGRYGPFPTGRKSNESWDFIGTHLPDCRTVSALENRRDAEFPQRSEEEGRVFAQRNPASGELEFFRLEALEPRPHPTLALFRFPALPTNRTDSNHWTYLGTSLSAWDPGEDHDGCR